MTHLSCTLKIDLIFFEATISYQDMFNFYSSSGTYESSPKRRLNAAVSSKQPAVSELSRRAQAPQPVYYSSQNSNNNGRSSSDSWQQLTNNGLGGGGRGSVIEVTNGRTKRLVQAPDNYRHPHGY